MSRTTTKQHRLDEDDEVEEEEEDEDDVFHSLDDEGNIIVRQYTEDQDSASSYSQDGAGQGADESEDVESDSEEEEEDDDSDDDDDDDEGQEEDTTWMSWFCSLKGNDFFCRVSDDFVCDTFNLTGLAAEVPLYDRALDTILNRESSVNVDRYDSPDSAAIEEAAELLYGLIHQRYILTKQGLAQMGVKFQQGAFGVCPRTLCERAHTAPTGRHDVVGKESVKLYCPRCKELYMADPIYEPVDGAFFGTTMAHLLFSSYPHLLGSTTSEVVANAPLTKYRRPSQFAFDLALSSSAPEFSSTTSPESVTSRASSSSSVKESAPPTTASSLALAHARVRTMTKWRPQWESNSTDDDDGTATMPQPVGTARLVPPPNYYGHSKKQQRHKFDSFQTSDQPMFQPFDLQPSHFGGRHQTVSTTTRLGKRKAFSDDAQIA